MKLINFTGNDVFSAVAFHNRIREKVLNLKKLTKQLEETENNEMDIEFKDGRSKDGGFLKLYIFDEVDPNFIEFVKDMLDNDMLKQSDFFIIKDNT